MIVGQLGQFAYREPTDVRVLLATLERATRSRYQSEIGHSYGVSSRVALRSAEGIELFEVEILDAGLLVQLAACGIIERFSNLHQTAGKRPASGIRPLFDLNQ